MSALRQLVDISRSPVDEEEPSLNMHDDEVGLGLGDEMKQ